MRTCVVFVLGLLFSCWHPVRASNLVYPVRSNERSLSCLPVFDEQRHLFEPCLDRLCFLFREDPPFVSLGAYPSPHMRVPFLCSSRISYLNGTFFDMIGKIHPVNDAFCVHAHGCTFNDLIYFLRDSSFAGNYKFISGGFLLHVSYRVTDVSIPSIPYLCDELVIYGLKKNRWLGMDVLSNTKFLRAIVYVLLTIVSCSRIFGVHEYFLHHCTVQPPLGRTVAYRRSRFRIRHRDESPLHSTSNTRFDSGTRTVQFSNVDRQNDVIFDSAGLSLRLLSRENERPGAGEIRTRDTENERPGAGEIQTRGTENERSHRIIRRFSFSRPIILLLSFFIFVSFPLVSRLSRSRLSDLSSNIREFAVQRGSASEHVFRELVRREGLGNPSSPDEMWSTYDNESELLKIIRNRTHPANFVLAAKFRDPVKISTVTKLSSNLTWVCGGWYYGCTIPKPQRTRIDRRLSTYSREYRHRTKSVGRSYFWSYVDFALWFAFCVLVLLSHVQNLPKYIWLRARFLPGLLKYQWQIIRRWKGIPPDKPNSAVHFQAIYKTLNEELGKHSPSLSQSEIGELEDCALSEYLSYETLNFPGFLSALSSTRLEIVSLINALDENEYYVNLPIPSGERLFVMRKSQNSFLVLIDDFFLVFEDFPGTGVFYMRVPGSPCVRMKHSDLLESPMMFEKLIGSVLPIQQVYLLVRRFVQFTGAKWEYNCLAQAEMKLPGANVLRLHKTRRFENIAIELDPLSFDCLSRCKVGYLAADDSSYSVGLEVFGGVIGFRRTESHIAEPFICGQEAKLEVLEDHTDYCELVIGGREHVQSVERRPNPQAVNRPSIFAQAMVFFKTSRTRTEYVLNVPPRKESQSQLCATEAPTLRTMEVIPNNLSLCSVMNFAIFNLAAVPKNMSFKELNSKKRYSDKDLTEMMNDFLQLGYGEQLARAIREGVFMNTVSSDYPITLAEAQHMLLKEWDKLTHRAKEAFNLSPKRYLKPGQEFLVLNSGKLYVVSRTKRITRVFSTGFGVKILGVGPSVNFQETMSNDDLVVKSVVVSVLDAAEKVSGHKTGFEKFVDGRGYIPTAQGMEKILGGLTFVCRMLENRVMAKGRFQNSVYVGGSGETRGSTQEVDFDLPIPCGVLSSTLARSALDRKHWLLVDGDWDADRDFKYPAFLGVGECDDELCEMVVKNHFL